MTKPFANLSIPKLPLPVRYGSLSPLMRRRVREQYMEEQGNLCAHCQEHLQGQPPQHIRDMTIHEELFPKDFFDHPIHLHHDHETGMTIGAVHALCNAVLWQHHGE